MRGLGAAFHRHAAGRLIAAFGAGAALNLAFAPFGLWPLAMLAPAALFALIRGLPPRRAAWTGGAFGVGLFACGTYWLYTSLHGYGGVPIWLTLVLQTCLVVLMAAYSAALCQLANRFWLKPCVTRDWLVLPALWVLLEWLRGWVLTGFPWLSLGYALVDSPLAGWAPVLRVYGVHGPLRWPRRPSPWRRRGRPGRARARWPVPASRRFFSFRSGCRGMHGPTRWSYAAGGRRGAGRCLPGPEMAA